MKVYEAEAHRVGAMGSLGDATCMLIKQHQFPDEFNPELDKMVGWDHDRIMQQEHQHGARCFEEHTGTGEMGLDHWAGRVEPAKVILFVRDILKADPEIRWT